MQSMSVDEGLIHVMDVWLPLCSRIQESWLAVDAPIVRYEDLLEGDLPILERVLLDTCGLPVDRELFREVVLANRFDQLSGRSRGEEDQHAHERKGIAGDWRRHFAGRIKRAFKARFGELLVAAGYESDLAW